MHLVSSLTFMQRLAALKSCVSIYIVLYYLVGGLHVVLEMISEVRHIQLQILLPPPL